MYLTACNDYQLQCKYPQGMFKNVAKQNKSHVIYLLNVKSLEI